MFKTPFFQFNGHLQTILPSLFRKVTVDLERERVELEDGDFLLLDWLKTGSKNCVIVSHGLEGDSRRHYVTGVLKKFQEVGFDGLGWNSRSCGGEMNRLPKFYHHGDASDLLRVIKYVANLKKYENIVLVGFSMGGSLTLRVLAEYSDQIPKEVKRAIAVSVPLDLPTSVQELNKRGKRFYMKRFIKKLKAKIKIKEVIFPNHEVLHLRDFKNIKDFNDFDNRFTAPLHGYANAQDFYAKASVKPILGNINVPSLIIQAQNDPFLTPECMDLGAAESNKNLTLLITPQGGHVGFQLKNSNETFVEHAAIEFCKNM